MQRNNVAGKRPLFISGSQRQMLHDIKENLLHATLQQQPQVAGGDAKTEGMQIKADLSGLPDKMTSPAQGTSSMAGPASSRDAGYNKLAMAQIRQSLEGHKATNSESKTMSQTKTQTTFEEQSTKEATMVSELVSKITIQDGRNGLRNAPGLSGIRVHRKPSFEDKYQHSSPGNSDNSSVRSDSPSLGPANRPTLGDIPGHSSNWVLVGAQDSMAMFGERHTPPPPLPPRSKPPASVGHNHTPPPPPIQSEMHKTGQLPLSVAQLASQRFNVGAPLPPKINHPPAGLLLNGQRRPSPVLNARHQHLMSPLNPTSVHQVVSSDDASSHSTSSILQPTTMTYTHGPPPPPPYVPNRPSPTFAHHIMAAERSHMVVSPLHQQQQATGFVQVPNKSPLSSHSPSPAPGARASPGIGSSPVMAGGQIGSPRPAAMQAWPARQAPIVMQKVNSTQVARPVLQTATGPIVSETSSGPQSPESLHAQLASPPLPQTSFLGLPAQLQQQLQHFQQQQQQQHYNMQQHHQYIQQQVHVQHSGQQIPHNQYNFISQVRTSVNTQIKEQVTVSSAQGHHPVGVGRGHTYIHPEVEHTRQAQTGHSQAQHYAIPGNDHLGRTIQINIQNESEQRRNNKMGVYGDALRTGLQAFPETPMSTPRSESPVPRGYNQSPVSVISTNSTPSTNSDAFPDKPPPPYPGRSMLANPTLQQQFHQYLQPHCDDVSSTTSSDKADMDTMLENETASSDKDSYTSSTKSSEQSFPEGLGSSVRDHLDRRRFSKVPNYTPQAYMFYMEQHMENIMKTFQQRKMRRDQLEAEMESCNLSKDAKDQMRKMLEKKESNYIRQKRAKMNKSMFDKIKTLGVGAFGEVALISKKDTLQLFAMKTLRKRDVLSRNQAAHVKAERDILAEADNEWVVKLYYSFQDKDNLYFVMDYIPGGDMMSLLIKFGVFEEGLAQFYIAQLVGAIESVHKMGFIHRDIKPDNILIDKDGHIKLTDFGLCTGFRWTHNSKYYQKGNHARQDSMEPYEKWGDNCHCGHGPHEKELLKPLERRKKQHQRCLAHSLVGTPNYIAPEILLRIGYSAVCDWWSVGVILYEMLVGQPPFLANSPGETQYKVINWQSTLHIPKGANLSKPASDIIIKLCCDHNNRLGKNGADEVKAHSFFKDINFDTLRKGRAPYVPKISHPTDTSNFDPVEPEKLRDSNHKHDTLENGRQPDHAFFEFTFRRFFDEGGNLYMPMHHDPMHHDPEFGDDILEEEEKAMYEEDEEEEEDEEMADGSEREAREETDSEHSQQSNNKGPAVYV